MHLPAVGKIDFQGMPNCRGRSSHGRDKQETAPETDEAGSAQRFGPSTQGVATSGFVPDIPKLIAEGYDPVHAVYLFVHHIASVFSENVSRLPEMRAYAKEVGEAEEEYMPAGPPMSPLTASFFTTWAFYDLRIGNGSDTLGTCLIDANDVIMMNPHQLIALKKLCDSRMGIYEHVGMDGPHIRLRELIDRREFTCHSTSGYRGRKGELWYVRLLPPLEPESRSLLDSAFTTPYILIQSSTSDWTQYLTRTLAKVPARSQRGSLHELLKHGPSQNYWSEFVFQAYHHHQVDAIYLAGIPDLKDTLPHA